MQQSSDCHLCMASPWGAVYTTRGRHTRGSARSAEPVVCTPRRQQSQQCSWRNGEVGEEMPGDTSALRKLGESRLFNWALAQNYCHGLKVRVGPDFLGLLRALMLQARASVKEHISVLLMHYSRKLFYFWVGSVGKPWAIVILRKKKREGLGWDTAAVPASVFLHSKKPHLQVGGLYSWLLMLFVKSTTILRLKLLCNLQWRNWLRITKHRVYTGFLSNLAYFLWRLR